MAEPDKTAAPAAALPAVEPRWRSAAVGLAAALVLFCSLLSVLMLVRYTQERSADPLNDRTLIDLRAKFMAKPEDQALKEAIRAKDLEVRREYFAIQWHLNAGAWMLVPSASLLIILLNLLLITRAPAPDPESLGGPAGVWRDADRRRMATAWFAVALLVMAAAAAIVFGRGPALKDAGAPAPGVEKVQK